MGSGCGLKDVGELLAQSGLAERTYTVIGQGLVDAALALKAEERRRLFEEAAGIGLHRSRREEALKRLDTYQAEPGTSGGYPGRAAAPFAQPGTPGTQGAGI